MNKQLDDELKRLCNVSEPDYYDEHYAHVFWLFKLAKCCVIAAFIVVGGCTLLVSYL